MRVTMEDIARMAGVSKATVSRVVNGIEQGVGPETRRRVLQIVKETNYRSYSLPSQNQSKTLGLIIPDIINPFFGELVKAIEGEATEQGYTVLLGNTDFSMEKEERYLSIFLAKRVDGIILVTTAQTAGEHYQRLKKYSVPCVLVDRMLAELTIEKEQAEPEEEQIFKGKTFVITGSVEHFANRGEVKALIESLGGKVTGSVTSKTDYLINNDVTSTSSKNKKARELGIPIISEDEFLKMT